MPDDLDIPGLWDLYQAAQCSDWINKVIEALGEKNESNSESGREKDNSST
jgi:hypothetical protein